MNRKLTIADIDQISKTMPGGFDGFLKTWGLLQFAEAVISRYGLQNDPSTDIERAGNAIQHICHNAAFKAGWWFDLNTLETLINRPHVVGEKLMLIVSEVAEAMEGHRKGRMDDHLPHRQAIEVELADAVIRIGDLAGALGLDLGGAIKEKMLFNENRPDHKPENRLAAGGKAY